MEENEKAILPPSNPLTVKINLAVLAYYFEWFCRKYLPAFKAVVTSSYRDPAKNESVGGAQNSAHLHGLAYDFVLQYPNGGVLPKTQAKTVFNEFILPNWAGFALWEEDEAGHYHIHVNLSRQITTYAAIAGVACLGVIGITLFKSIGGDHGGK